MAATPAAARRISLTPLKIAATRHISHQCIADTLEVSTWQDPTLEYLAVRLSAFVYELVDEDREYELVERPVPETWRDHLILSLPEGSFRRRWLEYFWDREDGPRATQATHTVRVKRATAFPDGHFPRRFGEPVPYTLLEVTS